MFATVAIGPDDASVLVPRVHDLRRTNMSPERLTRVDSHSDTPSPGLITAATRRPRSPVVWEEDGTVTGRILAAVMGPLSCQGTGAPGVLCRIHCYFLGPVPADLSVLGPDRWGTAGLAPEDPATEPVAAFAGSVGPDQAFATGFPGRGHG